MNRNYYETLVKKLAAKENHMEEDAPKSESVKAMKETPEDESASGSDEDEMETDGKIPKLKTKFTGTFPSWMTSKKIRQFAKAKAAQKRKTMLKKKKRKNTRFGK